MILSIKNISGEVLPIHIKSFGVDEVYQIPLEECQSWSRNDQVIEAIVNNKIIILSNDIPIEGVFNQINALAKYNSIDDILSNFLTVLKS